MEQDPSTNRSMNILWIPSVSMRSYTQDLWLLSRDAHWTQFENYARHLSSMGIKPDVIVPMKSDLVQQGAFVHDHYCNPLLYQAYKRNIAEARNDTGWIGVLPPKELVPRYDLIITGHPEYVRSLARIYPSSPIACILTHGPLINEDYLDSLKWQLNMSDRIFYNFAPSLFTNTFREHFKHKLTPMYRYAGSWLWAGNALDTPREPKTVLMLSRLTDNSRFDLNEVNSCLTRLANKGFSVYITDPSEGGVRPPNTHYAYQGSKRDFLMLLRRFEWVLIPYDTEKTYSVSRFEALACGAKVLTYKGNEQFVSINDHCTFDRLDEVDDILEMNVPPDPVDVAAARLQFYISRYDTVELLDRFNLC